MKIKIGLVDDHQLFLKSLSLMLDTLADFSVVVEALNGEDLQKKMATLQDPPDIMLIDVNMPVMDGAATAQWLQANYPLVRLAALSMNDKDNSIIKMFKAGCCAYLLKDVHPHTLERALHEIHEKGFFNSDMTNLNFRKLLSRSEDQTVSLTAKELKFLKLACSELTYKQIAAQLNLSERTIDGYREILFQKFHVQSRVGMCLEALRREFITL